MTQTSDQLVRLPEPFHPSASHVQPDYRDGWNACHKALMHALTAQLARSDFPPRILAVVKEMAQRSSSGHHGPWEDSAGEPLQQDADTALAWLAARSGAGGHDPDAPGARSHADLQEPGEYHKLDTPTHVFFYEQDFYVLSNFSAFSLEWKGGRYDTSEAAYHSEKFPNWPQIRSAIAGAFSAHDAFKIAELNKERRRADWDSVKVGIMRNILRAKANQHEYVRRKLLATGDRVLVEDSWRDDYWGWGPNRDGQNMLGRLWMEVRAELRESAVAAPNATLTTEVQ
ncbi:NADAR family protein [Variovorax sp. LjRoot178]|uniref:NADAR family protein n=1 Tax=Variovorax sp. LjRoot178 TaxID=3342277 RepID=UPI003ED0C003